MKSMKGGTEPLVHDVSDIKDLSPQETPASSSCHKFQSKRLREKAQILNKEHLTLEDMLQTINDRNKKFGFLATAPSSFNTGKFNMSKENQTSSIKCIQKQGKDGSQNKNVEISPNQLQNTIKLTKDLGMFCESNKHLSVCSSERKSKTVDEELKSNSSHIVVGDCQKELKVNEESIEEINMPNFNMLPNITLKLKSSNYHFINNPDKLVRHEKDAAHSNNSSKHIKHLNDSSSETNADEPKSKTCLTVVERCQNVHELKIEEKATLETKMSTCEELPKQHLRLKSPKKILESKQDKLVPSEKETNDEENSCESAKQLNISCSDINADEPKSNVSIEAVEDSREKLKVNEEISLSNCNKLLTLPFKSTLSEKTLENNPNEMEVSEDKCAIFPNSSCKYVELLNISSVETNSEEPKSNVFPNLFESCQNVPELKIEEKPALEAKMSAHEDHPKQSMKVSSSNMSSKNYYDKLGITVKKNKVNESSLKFGEVLTVNFSEVKLKEPISEKIKSVSDNNAGGLQKDNGNFESEKKDIFESNKTDCDKHILSATKIDSVDQVCSLLDTKNCIKTCFSKLGPVVVLSKLPLWVDEYKSVKVQGKNILKPIEFLEILGDNTKGTELVSPAKRMTRSDGKCFKVDFNATLPDIRCYKKRIKDDNVMLPFHGFNVPLGYVTLPENYFICRRAISFDSSDDGKVELAVSLDGKRGSSSLAKEVGQNRTDLSLLDSTEENLFDKIYSKIFSRNRSNKSKRSKKTASVKKQKSKSFIDKKKCCKDFCGFGCVCDSLMVKKRAKVHCGHEECMFSSYCCKGLNTSSKHSDKNKPSLLGTLSPKETLEQNKRIRKPPKRLFEDDMIFGNDYASSPQIKRPCIVNKKRTVVGTFDCNVLLSKFDLRGASVRCMYHYLLNCPCFVDESYEEKKSRNVAMKSTSRNLLQSSVSNKHARKRYLHDGSRSNIPVENCVESKLVRYKVQEEKKLASTFSICKIPLQGNAVTSLSILKTPIYNNVVSQCGVTMSTCRMPKEKTKLPTLSGLLPVTALDSRNSQFTKVKEYFRNFKEFQKVINSNDIKCKQLEMMCSFSLKPLPQNSIKMVKLCILDELIKNKLAYLWLKQRLNNRDRIFVTDNFSPPGFSCKYIGDLSMLPSEIAKKFTIETTDARKLTCFILTSHFMCWEIIGALDLRTKISITEDSETSELSGDSMKIISNPKNIMFSGEISGENGNLNMLLKKESSESIRSLKKYVTDEEADSEILEVTVEQLRNYGRPIFKKQLYNKIKRGEIDRNSINCPFTMEIQPLIRGLQCSPNAPYFERNYESGSNNEEFVWYRLDLNGEFDKLVYEEISFNISLTELMYAVTMSREKGCLLRVLFDQSKKDYEYPWKKGIYADPWINSTAVRIGPYHSDEYTGIVTFIRVDGLHRATIPLLKLESVTLKSDLCTDIEAYVHSECSGQYIGIENKGTTNSWNPEVGMEIDPVTCTSDNTLSEEAEPELDIKIQDVQGNWAGFNDLDSSSENESCSSVISFDFTYANTNNFSDVRAEVSNPRIDNQDGFHQSQMIVRDNLPPIKPVLINRFSVASAGSNVGRAIGNSRKSNSTIHKKVNSKPLSVKPKRSVAIKSTARSIAVTKKAMTSRIESSNIVLGYLVPDIPNIHPIPVAKGGMTIHERNILTMKNPIYKPAGTLHFINLEEANVYLNHALRKIIHFFPSTLRIAWSFLKVDSMGKNGKVDGLMELDKLTTDMFLTPKGLFHYDGMTREELLRCGIDMSVAHRFLEAKRRRVIYLAKRELLCLFPLAGNASLVKIMSMAYEDIKLQDTMDDLLSKEKESELLKKEMLLKKLKKMCTDAEMDNVMKKLQQLKRPKRRVSDNFSRISLQEHPKPPIIAICGNKRSRLMKLCSVRSFKKSILKKYSSNSNVSKEKLSAGTYQYIKLKKETLQKRFNVKSLEYELQRVEAVEINDSVVSSATLKVQRNDVLVEKVVCEPSVNDLLATQTLELNAVSDKNEVKSFSKDCIENSFNPLNHCSLPGYSILKNSSKKIPATKPAPQVQRNDLLSEKVFCDPMVNNLLAVQTLEPKAAPDVHEGKSFSKDCTENSFNPSTCSSLPGYSMLKNSSKEIPATKPAPKVQRNDLLSEKVLCEPMVNDPLAVQTLEPKAAPDVHEVKSFSKDCTENSFNPSTCSSLPGYSMLKNSSKDIPATKPAPKVQRNDLLSEKVFCEPMVNDPLAVQTLEPKAAPDVHEVESFSKDCTENSFNPSTCSSLPGYSKLKNSSKEIPATKPAPKVQRNDLLSEKVFCEPMVNDPLAVQTLEPKAAPDVHEVKSFSKDCTENSFNPSTCSSLPGYSMLKNSSKEIPATKPAPKVQRNDLLSEKVFCEPMVNDPLAVQTLEPKAAPDVHEVKSFSKDCTENSFNPSTCSSLPGYSKLKNSSKEIPATKPAPKVQRNDLLSEKVFCEPMVNDPLAVQTLEPKAAPDVHEVKSFSKDCTENSFNPSTCSSLPGYSKLKNSSKDIPATKPAPKVQRNDLLSEKVFCEPMVNDPLAVQTLEPKAAPDVHEVKSFSKDCTENSFNPSTCSSLPGYSKLKKSSKEIPATKPAPKVQRNDLLSEKVLCEPMVNDPLAVQTLEPKAAPDVHEVESFSKDCTENSFNPSTCSSLPGYSKLKKSSKEIPATKPAPKVQRNDLLSEKVLCEPMVNDPLAVQTLEPKAAPDVHEVESFSKDCTENSFNPSTCSSLPGYSKLKNSSKEIPATKPAPKVQQRNDLLSEKVLCEPMVNDPLAVQTLEPKAAPDVHEGKSFSKDCTENSCNPSTHSSLTGYSMLKNVQNLADKPGSFIKFEESITNKRKPVAKDDLGEGACVFKSRESGHSNVGLCNVLPVLTLGSMSAIPGNFEQRESESSSPKPKIAIMAAKELMCTSTIKKQNEIANELKNKRVITGIPIFSLEGEMHFSKEGLLQSYSRKIRCLPKTCVLNDAKGDKLDINVVSKTPSVHEDVNVTVIQEEKP